MKPGVLSAIAIAGVSIGCDLLVGIRDLPTLNEGGAADVGLADGTAKDVTADTAAVDGAIDQAARNDATFGDGMGGEAAGDGAPHDSAQGDRLQDSAMDRTTLPADANDAAADRPPIADANADASADRGDAFSCPLSVGADSGMVQCATCIETHCCAPLAACEAPDDAGLDDAGESSCIRLTNITLVCIVAVGDPSSNCTGANQYSLSAQQNTSALVACVQQACPTDCAGIIAIPGI